MIGNSPPKSPTSTGYSSNLTGSSATNRRSSLSPDRDVFINFYSLVVEHPMLQEEILVLDCIKCIQKPNPCSHPWLYALGNEFEPSVFRAPASQFRLLHTWQHIGEMWVFKKLVDLLAPSHNIIQIHNSVLRDWQYFAEYFSYADWMWGIFYQILSVPKNTVLNLNYVMLFYVIFTMLILTHYRNNTNLRGNSIYLIDIFFRSSNQLLIAINLLQNHVKIPLDHVIELKKN